MTSRGREETRALAEKIRQELKKRLFAEGISLKCSCGIACSGSGEETLEAEELFRRADRALYRAKNEGRDRVVAEG
uniref:diguanylate cyclase domain-containing protein n=1 Tax=Nitratifractor sp. TaxID=2268144 RepID=UPI0025E9880B